MHRSATLARWAAGLSALAALPAAYAQSNVTLYGTLDASAYSKQLAGELRLKSLASGAMTTSRWGISGTEDLGGGLRAIFDMSSFIRVDTGDSGRNPTDPFFGRFAYVGLASSSWGMLRMGRISTATFISEISFGSFLDSTTLGPYLLHTFLGSATQPMITGNGLLDSAWSNSISYSIPTLPSLKELSASVQVAAGEGTNGRRVGGGATWRGDTFGATFTFDNVSRGVLAVGAPSAATATAARPQYTATDVRTYQGGAYVDFKVARVYAQAARTTFSNSGNANEIKLNTYALSGTVPIGLGSFIAEWAHTTNERTGVADIKRDTASIGYDYFLSKRTDTYLVAMRDKVTNLSSGTGVALGLRHRF